MKRMTLIGASALSVLAPTLALAQADPGCVRSNNQTSATGTVLGALGGALIGDVIAGRHNRGVGAVGGALAGGVTGNLLAGQHNDPCPPAYPYGPPAPPPPVYYRQAPPPPPPRYEAWRPAPDRIHERIQILYNRIGDARANGWLGRHDAFAAYRDLDDIRRQEHQMLYRDGGALFPPDHAYLQSRLDDLSAKIGWQSHGG